MWEQTTWWLIGATALLFTGVSLVGLRENIVGLFVADAAGVILWVLWSINGFAITQVTNTGATVTHNYPSLGYLGLAFAFLLGLDLFVSVFEAMARESGVMTNGE